MARSAVKDFHVYVRACAPREPFEEIVDQLGLQIADAHDAHGEVYRGVGAATEIDRGHRQRLVHRHDEVAGAIDSAPVAQSRRDRFAEGYADVLDGMMLIDVEIAGRGESQIERAVPGDQFEHVIEEANAGADPVPAVAVEIDRHRDTRLGRAPVNYTAPHNTSSMLCTRRRVCSTMPVPIRMQPAHPGSVDRFRM